MDEKVRVLEDVARNLFANVVWTHKIQEKQAEIYEHRFKLLSVINIIFAALTSAGIVSTIFVDPTWLKVASAIVAFVTTALSAFMALYDYKSMAKANKSTATKLVCARDDLLTCLAKIKIGENPTQVMTEDFEKIQNRIHEIYSDAPNTSDKAVSKATTSIKKNKDGTYSDEEIDALLPDSLKRRQTDE